MHHRQPDLLKHKRDCVTCLLASLHTSPFHGVTAKCPSVAPGLLCLHQPLPLSYKNSSPSTFPVAHLILSPWAFLLSFEHNRDRVFSLATPVVNSLSPHPLKVFAQKTLPWLMIGTACLCLCSFLLHCPLSCPNSFIQITGLLILSVYLFNIMFGLSIPLEHTLQEGRDFHLFHSLVHRRSLQ